CCPKQGTPRPFVPTFGNRRFFDAEKCGDWFRLAKTLPRIPIHEVSFVGHLFGGLNELIAWDRRKLLLATNDRPYRTLPHGKAGLFGLGVAPRRMTFPYLAQQVCCVLAKRDFATFKIEQKRKAIAIHRTAKVRSFFKPIDRRAFDDALLNKSSVPRGKFNPSATYQPMNFDLRVR